jgi:hypothetical protein
MLEEKYTESIKNEIEKGRTFDEILNEVPSKDATEQELNAYFDAGDIAGIGEQSITNVSLLKVILLTSVVLILITGLISSPFILNILEINLVFLFPIVILFGVLLSFFGKKQNRAIKQFQIKQGLKVIEKYLTEDTYREKFDRQEKSKVRKFIINVVLLILTPIDFVCDSLISISTLLFPTK